MEEWKEYKIGEICGFQNGYAFKSTDFVDIGDYRVVKIKELKDGDVKFFNDSSYVTCNDHEIRNRFAINYLDVLFALTGDPVNKPNPMSWVGRVSLYKHKVTSLMNQRVCKTLPSDKIDNIFLYYYFRQPDVFYQLASKATGSASQANISTKTIADISICLPPIQEQKEIVSILKSLDDKIEVNRRINENLELQAQALFKSWFVDFEPFKDGEFIESELGMIPKGWRVKELTDIAEISKVSINPQKQPQIEFKHYSIPSYDDGMKPEIQLGEEIKSNKFVIKNKMTLFSKLNPRIKRVWFVDKLDDNSICSTEFVPYKAKAESKSSFLYSLINSQGFYDFVMSMVNGATGSHQRFHPEDSLRYKIAYNETYCSKYCEIATPIINKILDNREEARRLADLRDTLLPKLMFGEIKVNDMQLSEKQ